MTWISDTITFLPSSIKTKSTIIYWLSTESSINFSLKVNHTSISLIYDKNELKISQLPVGLKFKLIFHIPVVTVSLELATILQEITDFHLPRDRAKL